MADQNATHAPLHSLAEALVPGGSGTEADSNSRMWASSSATGR